MPDDAVRQCYHAHWKPEGKPIWFEASPGYLARQAAAERIARYFPATKFLVLLRDPVLRAFSAYNMWVRNRGFSQSFREAFEPVVKHITSVRKSVDDETAFYDSVSDNRERRLFTHGLYYHHLKIWVSFFPRDRFFILTTKQLNVRPRDPVTKKRVNSYGGDTIPTQVAREFAIRDYEMMSHQVRSLGAYSSFWKFTADQLIAREDLPAQLAYPFFQGNLWKSWCADHTPPGFSSGCIADRHDLDRLAG